MSRVLCLAAFCLTAATAAAQTTATFVGSTSDWHTPGNWSTGLVPDANTDVLISGDFHVIVSPPVGGGDVAIRDLRLAAGATLETLPGVRFGTRNESIEGGSGLIHRSTEAFDIAGGTTVTEVAGFGGSGLYLNPTPKGKRDIILHATSTFGLGGTTAAAPGSTGAGHYATLTTESIDLDGELRVELLYGFTPAQGQVFQIITTDSRTGTFAGLPEGARVATFGDVALYITYAAGDGNDVAIVGGTAIPTLGATGILAMGLALALAAAFALSRRRSRPLASD